MARRKGNYLKIKAAVIEREDAERSFGGRREVSLWGAGEMNWRTSILESEDAKDLRCKSLTRASVGNYILMSLSNKVSCKLVKPVNLSKRFCICLQFLAAWCALYMRKYSIHLNWLYGTVSFLKHSLQTSKVKTVINFFNWNQKI